MSGISSFIHYHVFRKLCDNNQQNNLSLKNIHIQNNVPDIEMGLNKPYIEESKPYIIDKSSKQVVFKNIEYWV